MAKSAAAIFTTQVAPEATASPNPSPNLMRKDAIFFSVSTPSKGDSLFSSKKLLRADNNTSEQLPCPEIAIEEASDSLPLAASEKQLPDRMFQQVSHRLFELVHSMIQEHKVAKAYANAFYRWSDFHTSFINTIKMLKCRPGNEQDILTLQSMKEGKQAIERCRTL